MCGIVGYVGGAGNSLTRVLTAMSALVYRAPDSTGVATFGDPWEPVRTVKAVGAVDRLTEALLDRSLYGGHSEALAAIWFEAKRERDLRPLQRRVLALEGFAPEDFEPYLRGERSAPNFDALVDLDPSKAQTLQPGTPGRPTPPASHTIRSRKGLSQLVESLARDHDLSTAVAQALLRAAFLERFQTLDYSGRSDFSKEQMGSAFDLVFERILHHQRPLKRSRLDYLASASAASLHKILWKTLVGVRVTIPPDFDRDGVRCLFRLLDAAMVSEHLWEEETPGDRIQQGFGKLCKNAALAESSWRAVYCAERGANVYGWAAAAVLEYLSRRLMEVASFDPSSVFATGPQGAGATHPSLLRFYAPPILAHGRYALQSAVTEKNSHPFFDRDRQRTIVLNGQFSPTVENEVKEYLRLAGYGFRSENSAEYMALLWGHYFSSFREDKRRFEAVAAQTQAGVDHISAASQTIDFKVWHALKDKSDTDMDETAFVEAARQMARDGGQIAVAGISTRSPGRMYVASHNRPVFIVHRPENDDFMVVSDVNAALGLFPQRLIHEKNEQMEAARTAHVQEKKEAERRGASPQEIKALEDLYAGIRQEILSSFSVKVYALEGPENLAVIDTRCMGSQVQRHVTFKTFDGEILEDLEPLETTIHPWRERKDIDRSFFESHLHEIPQRLETIFRFYAPDGSPSLTHIPVRLRRLNKRFGPQVQNLERLVLIGMGTSRHVGLMAKGILEEICPWLDVLVLSPLEIADPSCAFDPGKDLAIFLSWSGTTADVIECAKACLNHRIPILALTEKPFSDLALLTAKSMGTLPVMSGEEVTVSAIKSPLCMLHGLTLFGLWLASARGSTKDLRPYLDVMERLPNAVDSVLNAPETLAFAQDMARFYRGSHAAFVVDRLSSTTPAYEIAFKLEETAWTTVARVVDHNELPLRAMGGKPWEHLVWVPATRRSCRESARTVMKELFLADITFMTTTCPGPDDDELKELSGGRIHFLPELPEPFQVYVDLPFAYLFAYHYGRAQGRREDDFPRNLAKSVTTARTRKAAHHSVREHWHRIKEAAVGEADLDHAARRLASPSLLEQSSVFENERRRLETLRLAAASLLQDPAHGLVEREALPLDAIRSLLEEDPDVSGRVFFVPSDPHAASAVVAAVDVWRRLLGRDFRPVAPDELDAVRLGREDLLIAVSSAPPPPSLVQQVQAAGTADTLWVTAEPHESIDACSHKILPARAIQRGCWSVCYLLLLHLLHRVVEATQPKKAQALRQAFQTGAAALDNLLNEPTLRQDAKAAMEANLSYTTAYLIGSTATPVSAWLESFDRTRSMTLAFHPYGESAHGPLVTVDPRSWVKYVRLEPRDRMVERYGESQVCAWEEQFLDGRHVDAFLEHPESNSLPGPVRPFYDEYWYLPVLRSDYDANQDNLIVIDATDAHHLPTALDELNAYGCRTARILLITQNAFLQQKVAKALLAQPIGHLLGLPSLSRQDRTRAVPDAFAPLCTAALAAVLAAERSCLEGSSLDRDPWSETLRRSLGPFAPLAAHKQRDLRLLTHHLLTSLRNLAPVIQRVHGWATYPVRAAKTREELLQLSRAGGLRNPTEVLDHFRLQTKRDAPFFLVGETPQEGLQGAICASDAQRPAPEGPWVEAHGDTWRVLARRIVGMGPGPDELGLLLIPLLDDWTHTGRLVTLRVSYREWNQEEDLSAALERTCTALGKEAVTTDFHSPRYMKIVSHFNSLMASEGIAWSDFFLLSVPRRRLFMEGSQATAELIAEQVRAAASLLPESGDRPSTFRDLLDAFFRKTDRRDLTLSDEPSWWASFCNSLKTG
ncbi:hypothetical protein SAMN02746041_01635 [Desulfacinum hydrothermale DSM 13146]|uniref:Glutamine--fructose-6-phosphate aminotransferase [isomerizing] n=1 Tax=Desulfacinum hydrothermale DSM 13146 TaxID=1121390 RepID=A0A1W1XGC7_9BACT|nr:SIS domain-containing protein [Desulfacinum hydrothermale]SMC23056.1 hypothetical protein SAMN02746041_01635 [Desulfacinum hydrothermale DSM 13146]